MTTRIAKEVAREMRNGEMDRTFMRYLVQPSNEPDGEGNGWADCKPEEATAWIVYDRDKQDGWANSGMVECFDTKEQAEAWVTAQ